MTHIPLSDRLYDRQNYVLIVPLSHYQNNNIGCNSYFLIPKEDWLQNRDNPEGEFHLYLTTYEEGKISLLLDSQGERQLWKIQPVAELNSYIAI